MADNRRGRANLPPKHASFIDEYKEHVRTPAAILLGDATLILLGVFLMAIVRVALLGFLSLDAPPNIIDLLEMGDIYLTMVFLLVLGMDSLLKIIVFVISGYKK
jgi:hypothetical protein